jgi:hypothetical protein
MEDIANTLKQLFPEGRRLYEHFGPDVELQATLVWDNGGTCF